VAAAMNALEKPGLSNTEIMRLRTLIQTSGLYQQRFAEYVHYREIELKVDKAIEELQRLKKERERADKSRAARKRFSRSRTAQRGVSRAASFVRPKYSTGRQEVKK